ncbi:hypothetical protein FRC98_13420 [Lujinxingia vulgaris]|uniref:Uncharacterized protein n=1 Tax=Lujinxingia vulgaris TaxID=2600176 RepID=A0A5C6XBD9_9DELT|nr:hypothetical protein [Lujinxingia vulgaris]TXD36117.1 hypothetical protein FRC98_13420 [Lujinxingia vulgaris]
MTGNPNFWLPLTLAISLLAACGDDPEPTLVTFEDEGDVCLNRSSFQDDAPLEADAPIDVRVELPVCLSSSCSSQPQASCELAVDTATNTITLTSEGSYLDTSAIDGSCTADCGLLHAECEIPALPEGQYTLTHGQTTYTFDVPSEPTGCLEANAS